MASQPTTPPSNEPHRVRDYRFDTYGLACESAELYSPGNYHPVNLGDVINSRFRVIRKLGYGSFSTVWLVLDHQTRLLQALKIMIARTKKGRVDQELDIYRRIRSVNDSHQMIVELQDSFKVHGPNGSHLCLLFDPAGPNAHEMLRKNPRFMLDNPWEHRFPKDIAKQMLRDILLALVDVHRAGVVHADLHLGNVLFNVNLSGITPGRLQQQEPSQHLRRRDGKQDLWAPKYLLEAEPLMHTEFDQKPLVKIADFGAAFLMGRPPVRTVLPAFLRAPELVLQQSSFNEKIDVWSFGCLAFELLTGYQLFRSSALAGDRLDETINDEHLIQFTEVLGPLPKGWSQLWRRRDQYYDRKEKRIIIASEKSEIDFDDLDSSSDDLSESTDAADDEPPLATRSERFASLENLFHQFKPPNIDDREAAKIVRLLRWIFNYDPSRRPSAAKILQHRWIRLE